ncbi:MULTISPECIES: hypothetical protein [Peribacillus]|uniref:hypothetical protein n=1 Tax=Peribacillus TaxID=2675229 RepID=UPI0033376562
MPKGHHHLESNESSSHDSSSSHSGRRNRRPERLLKWFDFDETPANCTAPFTPMQTIPSGSPCTPGILLATITLSDINPDDRVFIEGTVGWLSNTAAATVQFLIIRDNEPVPVYSIVDTGLTGTAVATSFHHSETGVLTTNPSGTHVYRLYATTIFTNTPGVFPVVIGPISFEGQVIDENNT